MRDWSLAPGDPLCLTLAADARLAIPDYLNDHIWELSLGGGEPPALSLRTTFGLRARAMRLFFRFSEGGKSATDPAAFALPPTVRRFYPSFLILDYAPLPNIDVITEYWGRGVGGGVIGREAEAIAMKPTLHRRGRRW